MGEGFKKMNVNCEMNLDRNKLTVFRGLCPIAIVGQLDDKSDVVIQICNSDYSFPNHILTFNDIAIIQDNWNQMQEIINGLKAEIALNTELDIPKQNKSSMPGESTTAGTLRAMEVLLNATEKALGSWATIDTELDKDLREGLI